MSMVQIPDHPDIRKMEMYGTLNPNEPDVDDVRCPICDKFCDTIYTDRWGDAVGCEHCVRPRDAYEWMKDKE